MEKATEPRSLLLTELGVPPGSGEFLSVPVLRAKIGIRRALRLRRAGLVHPAYRPPLAGFEWGALLGVFGAVPGSFASLIFNTPVFLTAGLSAVAITVCSTVVFYCEAHRTAAALTAARQWLSQFPTAHLQQLLKTDEVESCSDTRRVVYDILGQRHQASVPAKPTALQVLAGQGAPEVLALESAQAEDGEVL